MTRTTLFLALVLVTILSFPALAGFTANEYIHSTGGLTLNNDQTFITGDNISVWPVSGQYTEINAGQQAVTLPGNSEADTQTAISAGYEQSTNLRYSGGGAVWDTLYLGSSIPNESVLMCSAGSVGTSGVEGTVAGTMPLELEIDGQIGAMGPNGEYWSEKYADQTNYALSGDFVGRGNYYGDLIAASGAGSDPNSSEQAWGSTMKRHVLGVSNLTGGVIASTDWTADDPREQFNFTEAVNTPANVTPEENTLANETQTNVTTNETEEE